MPVTALRTPDALAAQLAATQYGAISRAQALDLGLTDRMIEHRLKTGRWRLVAPGVYVFADHEPSFRQLVHCAHLDAGPSSVVSHETAGALHHFRGVPPFRLAVTVPHGRHHRNTLAAVHQTTRPARPVRVDGLPVTSPARTIVDLAKVSGPRRLADVLDDALADRKVSLERVRSCYLDLAVPGRPGMPMLGALLVERGEGYVPPMSELERVLDELILRVPGAPPVREFDIADWGERPHRVDRLFVPEKVILEGDGRRWHDRVKDFTGDRRRDRMAIRKGYKPLRYAYEELVNDADELLEELLDILGRSSLQQDSSVPSTA